MVIGPPIDTRGKSAAEINRQAEAWIEAQMADISTAAASSSTVE